MAAIKLETKARDEAEKIMLELPDAVAPLIKRLTTEQLGDVLGLIQLGYARGYLHATTYQGDKLREMMPTVGLAVKRRRK